MNKPITPEEIVNFLNDLLAIDRVAITNLFSTRVFCNKQLMGHPTVQVYARSKEADLGYVGFIGILNGLLGNSNMNGKIIAANYEGNELKEFVLLEG